MGLCFSASPYLPHFKPWSIKSLILKTWEGALSLTMILVCGFFFFFLVLVMRESIRIVLSS